VATPTNMLSIAHGSIPTPPIARESDGARPYPGQGSMWFFVIGDLWIFACYFACYVYERAHDARAFLEGQRLLRPELGVLDTVLLVTSSLFVAISAKATRAGDTGAARRALALGGALGAGFLLTKACEWYLELRTPIPASVTQFFVYYFMLTGLHFCHVLLGLLILTLGWRELRNAPQPRARFVEACGTYWHMVDALWMAIFAALYLMR
jgi:nitric oxide reductase NorE protein